MSEEFTRTDTATATCDRSSGTELDEEREFVFKVVVVGDYGVGKTSIVKRLLSVPYAPQGDAAASKPAEGALAANNPCRSVTPTVGTDFFSRVVRNVRGGQHVRLQFWDTAGLERYAAVHATTHRNASAVMVVFDVSDRHSLESLLSTHLSMAARYSPDLDQRCVIVVGNKTDLLLTSKETGATIDRTHAVTQWDIQSRLLELLPDVVYHEVSAVTNLGMASLLHSVCHALLIVHGGEEFGAAQEGAGKLGTQLQHSVLPTGTGPAPADDTTAAAPPASPAGVEVSPMRTGKLTGGVNGSHAAHRRAARDSVVTEQYVDPHDMPPSTGPQPCGKAPPPSVHECAAALEENSLEDDNRDDNRMGSMLHEECTASPPYVPYTLCNTDRLQNRPSNPTREENDNLLLDSNRFASSHRKTTEYSSADSGDFQLEIENRFRRAEDNIRRNASASRKTKPPKNKRASKVKLSQCCTGGGGRASGGGGGGRSGSSGGGGAGESAGRSSKGCKC